MLASAVPTSDSRAELWNCLDYRIQESHFEKYHPQATQLWGARHIDDDLIGLRRVCGIDIPSDGSTSQYLCQDLDAEGVSKWLLQDTRRTNPQRQPSPHTKILLGYQAMTNDGLRVFEQLSQTHISRSRLSKTMHIPRTVIDNMGMEESMSIAFPQPPGSSGMLSYAVTGCTASCAWSYDIAEGYTRALIVIRHPNVPETERLLHLLETLKDFGHHPGYLIYALIDIEVCRWSRALALFERDAATDDLNIQRFLMGKFKNLNELFGVATMRIGVLDFVPRYAPPVLEATVQNRVYLSTSPSNLTTAERSKYESDKQALAEALAFRKHELEGLIVRSNNLRRQTTTMLTTIMGLMSFNQQASTSDIGQATKDDSTSMRTLSILAALYLPSTAISAIMAIPIFNWDAPTYSQVVSPRIWVFFVVTIPLTCVTMTIFWYWVRLENSTFSIRGEKIVTKGDADKMV